jgi:diadenosine tetraphosphate (Ap4A) HIT family hydrolase
MYILIGMVNNIPFLCFFCDIQKDVREENKLFEGEYFFSRYSDFPVSKGHCEVVAKDHIVSFFDLEEKRILDLLLVLKETKVKLDKKFSSQGYNVGINQGKAAGASINHLHIHLIPRYLGDVVNPTGGVRNILPGGDYTKKCEEEIPERIKYFK